MPLNLIPNQIFQGNIEQYFLSKIFLKRSGLGVFNNNINFSTEYQY